MLGVHLTDIYVGLPWAGLCLSLAMLPGHLLPGTSHLASGARCLSSQLGPTMSWDARLTLTCYLVSPSFLCSVISREWNLSARCGVRIRNKRAGRERVSTQ